MAQEQQQINGVDMEAYEDFKKRHATRTPTEFAKVMHRTDPEHGFELYGGRTTRTFWNGSLSPLSKSSDG